MPEVSQIEMRHLLTMAMKGERHVLGESPWGQRRLIVVKEAQLDGPRIKATMIPGSGSDWVREATDGVSMIDCRMTFRTDDDAVIHMRYEGIRRGPAEVIDRVNRGERFEPSEIYHRVAVFFETAAENYLWMNGIVGVGLIRYREGGPAYEIFELL
jgi:hypothetical protein